MMDNLQTGLPPEGSSWSNKLFVNIVGRSTGYDLIIGWANHEMALLMEVIWSQYDYHSQVKIYNFSFSNWIYSWADLVDGC